MSYSPKLLLPITEDEAKILRKCIVDAGYSEALSDILDELDDAIGEEE